MTKILVVEDDRTLRDVLTYNLRREGYTPLAAEDAPTGVALARQQNPDLIVLDVMLPGTSGFDACREIRRFSPVPIIMLTARGEEMDRILGLELGADDYVTKPFNLRELLARIRANLRRVDLERESREPTLLAYGPLRIDIQARRVAVDGRSVLLQPREFDLLAYLVKEAGIVLRREQILSAVWGHDFVGERTVDVHVRRLRAKLEAAGAADLISTVHGVGYSLRSGNETRVG